MVVFVFWLVSFYDFDVGYDDVMVCADSCVHVYWLYEAWCVFLKHVWWGKYVVDACSSSVPCTCPIWFC